MLKDLWALWPDHFMVPLDEVSDYTHRSDDYEIVEVLEYDAELGYEPIKWKRNPTGDGTGLENR